ncbi:hypothetical protein [Psychroserpens sp.]|uniref:hypothetical protein n=1 Tax=Psychroserpens sp. TaxID=2020870 RepID=UPI001B2582B3|nr:hypothetical protein [Psychroserpens sp.]MBO6631214.1 hypothetical protein [Psychroserpens sp.]MBO6654511.1 hypothetical protein [Psychroserpens sp.]MBO6681140.1 hypothetical protein [Psychroserpens sp.]MBO6749903.1 hypothetical protein [Psychroserpens sp.]MBO6916109.1 hypothetical protein [Psychroserpens sp.]
MEVSEKTFYNYVEPKYRLDEIFDFQDNNDGVLAFTNPNKIKIQLDKCLNDYPDYLNIIVDFLETKKIFIKSELRSKSKEIEALSELDDQYGWKYSVKKAFTDNFEEKISMINKWINSHTSEFSKKEPLELNKLFSNNFDSRSQEQVHDYFYKALVQSKYLTIEDFYLWLELAFDKLEKPKIRFEFKREFKINTIRRIFYKFYSSSPNKYRNKEKYASLLGDYFHGFSTPRVDGNFSD